VTENQKLIVDTIRQVGQQIGWFDPQTKRFCYNDEKEHFPRMKKYKIPVYAIPDEDKQVQDEK